MKTKQQKEELCPDCYEVSIEVFHCCDGGGCKCITAKPKTQTIEQYSNVPLNATGIGKITMSKSCQHKFVQANTNYYSHVIIYCQKCGVFKKAET